MLSVVAVGTAGADHESSDEWEGSFDPAVHSTIVTYAWSVLRDNTYRCDTPAGCVWRDDGVTFYSHGDTYVSHCEFLGANQVALVGDCSDSTPAGWKLTQSTLTHHDPPTWSLRFCTQPGWGQNSNNSAWGTTDGPINDGGHRATLDSPPLPSMWGPLPSATTVNEPPFCGDWNQILTVSVSDATVTEGGQAAVTVTAAGSGSGSVQYRTVDGTATAGRDFRGPGPSTLTFSGPGTRQVRVDTVDDSDVEGNETFTVVLSNPSGVDIGTGTATVTIIDNDSLGTVNIIGATVTEGGTAEVTVTLSGGNGTGTVNYATADGSATAPSDYTTTTNTLTFTPTATSHKVRVPTNDDDDDEGTETFTVRLTGASNVRIGTAEATVYILDDDDPDPPQRCQAGEHAHNPVFGGGYHPPGLAGTDAHRIAHGGGNPATGCFGDHPTLRCHAGEHAHNPVFGSGYHPVGLKGTDDHRDAHGGGSATDCFADHPDPVGQPVQTGCNAPSTRLSALSATAGTYRLSGFSPTAYSYSLAVIGVLNVQVSATAADSGASVSIYGGPASLGSASRRVSSHNSFGVKVTNSGQSCTYRVEMSYEAAPLTSCPAFSGQTLVNGVCVEDCPTDTLIPQFDSNGEVYGCLAVGDCPYELYGLSGPPANPYRGWSAVWPRDSSEIDPVSPGRTVTETRTAVKCTDLWRLDPTAWSEWPNFHQCVWDESNLKPSVGDCLSISMRVEAVIPAVEADARYRNWSFRSPACGNQSAPRVASTTDPWTADDAVCDSSSGAWSRSSYCFSCSSTAPTNGPGEWAVTLDDANLTAPGGTSSPYVDIPIQVSVTDWGDASHLRISLTATPTYVVNAATTGTYAQWSRPYGQNDRSASTYFEAPRRSGPPPSDDIIEVKIADVDDLPYSSRYICTTWFGVTRCGRRTDNERFVDILRDELLANDACPIGTDCSDPLQWPIEVVGDSARRCTAAAFAAAANYRMQSTSQGLVGCDDLNDTSNPADPASVQYWPQLWAVGEDTFSYHTYGGVARVTIRFADQPPSGVTPVTSADLGHTLQQAHFPRTNSDFVCIRRLWAFGTYRCQERAWQYTHTRDDSSITDALYHSGVVQLPSPVDADGDYAGTRLTTAAPNVDVEGRYSIRADMLSGLTTDFYTETYDAQTGDGSALGRSCLRRSNTPMYGWLCHADQSRTLGGRQSCATISSGGHCQVETLPNAQTRRLSYTRTHQGACEARTVFTTFVNTVLVYHRYIPVAGQTECAPSDVFACGTDLAAHAVCYSAKRLMDQPAELTVPYIACDDRYLHFLDDQADAEAAGHTVDDYCATNTATVYLGGTASDVALTSNQYTAAESRAIRFDLQLSQASPIDVVVDYTVTPVTATAGSDYLIPPGQVTIPAGDTTATIYVFTTQDATHETDETLTVRLDAATGTTLGSITQATGTITNNDAEPVAGFVGAVTADEDTSIPLNPPVDLDGDGIPETEYVYGETMTFTVRLVGDTDLPATVIYNTETASGTATSTRSCPSYPGNSAEDYRQGSGTLTFMHRATRPRRSPCVCVPTISQNLTRR